MYDDIRARLSDFVTGFFLPIFFTYTGLRTDIGSMTGGELWFLCGLESQKARNLARDDRVSITIDHDTPNIMSITGLSGSDTNGVCT